MEDLFAIVLAIVGTVCVQPAAAASNNLLCSGLPNGALIANPDICQAYWICHNGIAIAAFCPIGFNFNPATQSCVIASGFDCTEDLPSYTPSPTTTTTIVQQTTELPNLTTPGFDVQFSCPPTGISMSALPHSCNAYRFCFMGVLHVRQCAANLRFDRHLLRCNFRSLVDCDDDVCPPVSDPNVVITLGSRTRCDEFFVCYNGEAKKFECATGLFWNQMTQNCDLPSLVMCT